MIKIKESDLQLIKGEGRLHYPDECCGLLIGKKENNYNVVVKVIPTINDWENQRYFLREIMDKPDLGKQENFAIAPKTMLQIQKEVRGKNLDIIGIYHSHPNHPAIPSEFDRAIAWEGYSYIIMSVVEKQVEKLFCWQLDEDRRFQEENIIIY
ncbi:M67 family metallopeptidase [Cyanobacterium stanieri LEGE 03274]|uniref:M67 family metallopeptidase n=1 Tax=Cyanobacterium stanieri LEGE 03274 TaxID=1828756 RepID=A0ABR9V321_9CHRO|nr:M67 family metallopeptidase [Cyanobacterium stanieri]MBE9222300.1 M67 family metallopeptidase [Cyanobacterium stanieri LEGE 03274]